MLDLSDSLPSNRTGALRITSPVLVQPKIFLIYSNHCVQNPFPVVTLQNWRLICWRLLLSGLRSVLGNATDSLKPPQTNNPICFRDLVPSDRATCTIASRVNFFISNKNLRIRQLEPWCRDVDRQAFHNHQMLYILNIPAIFKASAYPEILLVHRLVLNVSKL